MSDVKLSRRRKLMLNISFSVGYQLLAVICGFILPRYLLLYFGSDVNGLVASIKQFLSIISLAEAGIAVVIQASMFGPLAEHDDEELSRIVVSSDRFYHRLGWAFAAYAVLLALAYPYLALESFGYVYIASLVLILGINTFAQYYFCLTYRILLNADQLTFVQVSFSAVTLVLNTAGSVALMIAGAGVHMVMLLGTVLFMVQPIGMHFFVKRYYHLDRKVELHGEPIKQKWSGLAQHVAFYITQNTDVVVLTVFTNLATVSVYAVYSLVANGLKGFLSAGTVGFDALWGDMYAKRQMDLLQRAFAFSEWYVHTLVTFAYVCCGFLIVPFVGVYTTSINDADYYAPLFAMFLVAAQFFLCLRWPYADVVRAAGRFKETQMGSFVEAGLNIGLSVLLVWQYGLVGVAVGTLVAMFYRTADYVLYLSRHIIHRPVHYYIRYLATDALAVGLVYFILHGYNIEVNDYWSWCWQAGYVMLVTALSILVVNILFYRQFCWQVWHKVLQRLGR